MRVNVYTEELLKSEGNGPVACEIVTAEYISSRTGEAMKNYGLRIYLASSEKLHYIPGRDDDRSAITFWCGSKEKNVFEFLELLRVDANASTLKLWSAKTATQTTEAETAEAERQRLNHHEFMGGGATSEDDVA